MFDIVLEGPCQMSGALLFDAVTNNKQRDQRGVVLEGLRYMTRALGTVADVVRTKPQYP